MSDPLKTTEGPILDDKTVSDATAEAAVPEKPAEKPAEKAALAEPEKKPTTALAKKKKLAVITGASSGIGRATALKFARSGWTVVALARTRAALEELQREAGDGVVVEAVDAGDGAAVRVMGQRIIDTLGVPDAVINCAGLGTWKYLEDTSPEELATMMGAPFFAAAHVTSVFVGHMVQRGSGRIFHVGSPASVQPWPGSTAYASARWALRGLHEALRMDLANTGVTTSHVIFGEVTSAYFDNNPGSHEHIPKIARILPVIPPEQCGDVLWELANAAAPPPAEIFHPFMLRLFFILHGIAPWAFRWSVIQTGRKRDKVLNPPTKTTSGN